MKNATLALNFCIAALMATTPPARAAPRDISAEIAALRPEIVSAKVFHLPDRISFRRAQREEDVAKGCFYVANGTDLTALLDVLATAGLHEVAPSDGLGDVRTIVYLAKDDGSTVPLVLDLHSPGMPTRGSYDRTVPVEADGAFSTALHAWMSPRTKIDPTTSEPCTGPFNID